MHILSGQAIFNLKGWVAVVTGGGTGIGLIAAQALAANGAKVYITGRRQTVLEASAKAHGTDEALHHSGGAIIPLQMDVTSKESIQKAIEVIGAREKYVNVLVNNAGIGSGRAGAKASDGPEAYAKAMFDEEMEDWQKVYLANCTSLYFVTAAFVPLLNAAKESVTRNSGNVIIVSSQSGITKWSQNGQYAYNASKAAANHLTRTLAYELAEKSIGIRVNAICPGGCSSLYSMFMLCACITDEVFALGYWPSELTTGSSDQVNKTTWEERAFEKEMVRVGAIVPASRPGTDEEMASVS